MTNRIAVQTVIEFMSGYTPLYTPIYSLFLGGKSKAYPELVGTIDFKRVVAVGDVRQHRIDPKDTEIQQIAATDQTKTFKKYFFGNQYRQSQLQDPIAIADVISQALDEHHKQADDILLTGDGQNNGLYTSSDPNYVLSGSVASGDLVALHDNVMASKRLADKVAGRKIILFYGSTTLSKVDSLYPTSNRSFREVLNAALGPNYSVAQMPPEVTPANAEGWMVINLDQIMLHYTTLPKLDDQNVNAEKKYSWHNFAMGSMMVEVLAKYGIVRQPATYTF